MHDTGNSDFGWRVTHHGRQEHAAQSITQRVTVATLKRLHHNFGMAWAQRLNFDNARFQEIVLHECPFNTLGSLHR